MKCIRARVFATVQNALTIVGINIEELLEAIISLY